MKKLALIAAILMFMAGVKLYAGDSRTVPTGNGANPITADYAGVDYWGTTFSNFVTTVALPSGVNPAGPAGQYGTIASTAIPNRSHWTVYGAYFSTGVCGFDFIEVSQSTGGFVAATSSSTIRFYNVGNSTGGANGLGMACSGTTYLRWPVHMQGNVFMRPSNAGYNQQGLLYYKEPD